MNWPRAQLLPGYKERQDQRVRDQARAQIEYCEARQRDTEAAFTILLHEYLAACLAASLPHL